MSKKGRKLKRQGEDIYQRNNPMFTHLKGIAALINDNVVGMALHVSCIGNAVLCARFSYMYRNDYDQWVFQHRPLVGLA